MFNKWSIWDIISGSNCAFTVDPGYDNCTGLWSIICNVLTTVINGSSPPLPPQPTVVNVSSVIVIWTSSPLSLRGTRTV